MASACIPRAGRAVELTPARELIEITWTIGGDDADRADPAAAIRLARDPAELHRQFAFFEGDAGMCRTAQRSDDAGQCDAKGGGAKQRPPRKSSDLTSLKLVPSPKPGYERWQWPHFNAA